MEREIEAGRRNWNEAELALCVCVCVRECMYQHLAAGGISLERRQEHTCHHMLGWPACSCDCGRPEGAGGAWDSDTLVERGV